MAEESMESLMLEMVEFVHGVKEKHLGRVPTEDEVNCGVQSVLVSTDLGYTVDDIRRMDHVAQWYWEKYRSIQAKNALFSVRGDLWTYDEYKRLGISAVKGMCECAVCGRYTNVTTDGSGEYICSKNCLDTLKKGR